MNQTEYEASLAQLLKASRLSNGYWCGPRGRRMLNLVYALAFTCLLWIDEVLKVQFQDIENKMMDGKVGLQLTLPFRKTDQFGGKSLKTLSILSCWLYWIFNYLLQHTENKPFALCELPFHMAHLCPIRAYARWVAATEMKDGYIFRRLATGDRLGEKETFMVSVYFNI